MEDTEAPVSSKGKADSMVPDSLEFDTNTSRDPQDQTMSLQELIDAELTNRLSPQDSLEVVVPLKDGQADLESLISSDSIEDELRIKKEDADQLISLDSVESVNIDVTNSNKLSLNLDDLAKAEVESGIEVLSPNKVNAEDLSLPSGCHDSLESSSDLPGSPARSTPDPASPSAAQQTFGHQTLAPADDLGLNSSVDKSNSSSAEDSTAATTVIPQTDDLLGLDSSFTNVSYSVQTVSNSSLEENLLESFSSVPSTFQKQGTLESYDDACGGFDIMDDSELYMDDEKGTRTETTSKIHVVTRDTDLPRSYSIVSEGFNEEEEFEIESNLMGTEESDLLTNVDGNRELGIDKNIDQILVDVDTKKTDFEEFSDAAEKEFESSADILASLTCKEDLKIVEDQMHPEMGENGEETKESNVTEAFETKDLEIVENHINDNSTKEDKDLDIFGENQESSIEPDKEKMETAAEVGITKTTDDDSVLEVDLLNAENVMTTGSVKIIVTEEKEERRDSDCDLRRASDGELVIVEDSTTQGNPEDQMESDLTQETGQPSDAEVQLPHYYEAPKRTETKASQSSKELGSSEAELIQVSQETSSAEAFDELIIVEDTDKVNTEITKISENERTVVDKHGGSTHEGQSSTDSFSIEKSTDVLENTPQEVIPDTPSSNQIKSDLEKAENSTSAKSEASKATPDTVTQDLVDTSNPLTSDNTPSTPGRNKSLNSSVLSSEKMHGGVGDDLLTSNDNVSKQEAPNTNADMRRRAYESDEEEEGFFGNDDDLPSLKPKKGEEEDEEPPEEDEDEEAARTAFLMKMADGYEGEEREAVEAFIRSKLEQEKADKDEGDKAAEDDGEKKKKKKKRSEGGEKKSRKKKKKSDDKAPSQPSSDCRMCGKQVFQMEKIVAEKATWHKNCFRCKECNKNLTLETYQSHEGALYCKPHFKELFRPKAVVEDEATARKDRSTDKPDYGLEELQTNVREKFAMFETASKEEEETKLEPVSVRRSQSLLSRVARFQRGDSGEEYGVENSELGEYEDEEDEEGEEEEEEEEFDDENADPDLVRPKKKKKERPMSIGNMGDLKAAWETKNRRAEMAQNRKEELAKFRQMLCAGKNLTLKEMFESGSVDGEKTDKAMMREEIKIDGKRAASSLKEKFEQGRPFFLEDEENGVRKANGEREEVEEIFKEAETAHKARNIFKQIDSRVTKEGLPVMRSHSFAQGANENRLSRDGLGGEDQEIGRDPNLIRCSDNYQDDVDCKNTRNVLAMFKKMELQANDDDDEAGPKPLKRFTPPPDGEYDDEDEYSDEEYSDEEYSDEEDEDEEDSEGGRKSKYQDEVLEMAKQARKKSPQSAKKAASLRAKFERWESDQNEVNVPKEDDEECMPSIDTAKNLKAMFETKAQEVLIPKVQQPKVKVNRFVGGGGDKCFVCDKTVYAMEKLELQGKILHKSCFRCCKCNTKLSMGSFSMGGDRMYCTTHYKQLFAEKGTYEVFSPNGTGKWARKIEATPNNEETEPKSNS